MRGDWLRGDQRYGGVFESFDAPLQGLQARRKLFECVGKNVHSLHPKKTIP
jgi:hypothetical protein